MARKPRTIQAQLVHHVVHRGINRQRIFLDDLDRRRFLRLVSREFAKRGVSLWAFCLMDNHFHLLLHDSAGVLSRALQVVISAYTLSFNLRHGCEGALLRGRFYSVPVRDGTYLLEVQRYIHRNPLVANMVTSSGSYNWSSYRHYLEEVRDRLVETRPVLALLRECGITAALFPAWTDQGTGRDGAECFAQPLVSTQAIKQLPGALAASESLAVDIHDDDREALTLCRLAESEEDRRRARLSVIERCSERLGMPKNDLLVGSRGKGPSRWQARCIAMLACQREADATILELAQDFGVAAISVNHMLRFAKTRASDPQEKSSPQTR